MRFGGRHHARTRRGAASSPPGKQAAGSQGTPEGPVQGQAHCEERFLLHSAPQTPPFYGTATAIQTRGKKALRAKPKKKPKNFRFTMQSPGRSPQKLPPRSPAVPCCPVRGTAASTSSSIPCSYTATQGLSRKDAECPPLTLTGLISAKQAGALSHRHGI